MAHDNQYKDQAPGILSKRFDYPRVGESYWNRYTHRVEVATANMVEKFLIVEEEK